MYKGADWRKKYRFNREDSKRQQKNHFTQLSQKLPTNYTNKNDDEWILLEINKILHRFDIYIKLVRIS